MIYMSTRGVCLYMRFLRSVRYGHVIHVGFLSMSVYESTHSVQSNISGNPYMFTSKVRNSSPVGYTVNLHYAGIL